LHFTHESIKHLSDAKKILWLGTIEGLKQLVLHNNWDGEDITSYYSNGALDSDNYKEIKNKVLTELDVVKDIALVVPGHPRLGVTIVQEFQQEANQKKLKLISLPGISSFDTMINDLGLDPIEEGSCLVDANRLVLYDYHMDPCLNYIIYHVCSIGNENTDYQTPTVRNAVFFLKEKLIKHFPIEHDIFLLTSSSSDADAVKIKGEIKELDQLLENVSFASSLFIPALLPRATQINKKFYTFMTKQNMPMETIFAD
jgi:uncharacterized protein YabN with tetrapyrrole methylase and pyrophosphatase domain